MTIRPSLPLFARHDIGAGKKIKPITTRTGQNIVAQRVTEAVGPGSAGSITPHSFRHYFVTTCSVQIRGIDFYVMFLRYNLENIIVPGAQAPRVGT